jgi:cell division protein FtsL
MARAAVARKPAPRKASSRSSTAKQQAARRSARSGARRNGHARTARRDKPARTARRSTATARSARLAAGRAVALPLPVRVLQAPVARAIRARGGSLLDALLHGQGWIALVGVLLAGIVFCNVYLLELNRDIAATSERAAAVKRENARLRLDVARLGSSERIQQAAARLGLVLPAPGEVRYLKANPSVDGRRAAKRVEPPGMAEAPAPMAPEPLAPEPVAPVATGPTTEPMTTDPATDPAATDQAATAPAATAPAPTAEGQAAPAPTDPAAG